MEVRVFMKVDEYRDLADYLKALAHPTRLKILKALLDGEMCVKPLWEELDLQQSNVSQHLTILRSQNIIASRREGSKICYSVIDPKTRKVLRTILASSFLEEEGSQEENPHPHCQPVRDQGEKG